VAPGAPLADAEPGTSRARLAELLDELTRFSALLPALGGGEFAALYRRLAQAEMIRPHRAEFLPVQVTGLLEARLEHYDLLILAGLGEHVFPKDPPRRTLLLGRVWREQAGLPDWRHDLGLDAELFLRLLHAGDTVRITWSRERDGQPALPSPLVGRLVLALETPPAPRGADAVWRAAAAEGPDAAGAQTVFTAEPTPRRAHVPVPIPTTLSHSSLRIGIDCPYRWLLERGLGLREAEPLRDELQKKDYGTIVHDALRRFVLGTDGAAALRSGDRRRAREALHAAAAAAFTHGAGELPQRGLWEAAFLRAGEEIVDVELAGAARWTPVGAETRFSFPLSHLAAWAGHPVPAELADVKIEGRIDRHDRAADGSVRVIDYKTGTPPTPAAVAAGRDLQLGLYALAVRLGAVDGTAPEADLIGVYYGLKSGSVGPAGKPHLGPDQDLQRDAVTLLSTAVSLLGPDAVYPLLPEGDPDDPQAPCRFCGLRGACRVDEVRKEARP
jgi:ATP-dependent helicase/nuclease subunit B